MNNKSVKYKMITSILLALGTASVSASPQQLYISEYVEGSSYNKALELTNSSEQQVNLSEYQIKIYFNGNSVAGSTFQLEGWLGTGEVYVIADAKASADITSVANQVISSAWFNGDDAVVLMANEIVVDSIGQIGVDPGAEWGNGYESSKDNTLRRLTSLSQADTNPYDTFDPSEQWLGYANNNFADLGIKQDDGIFNGAMVCGDPADKIHVVQGDEAVTSMLNQSIQVEAIVVGDFQENNQLNGFFLQEESQDQDNTSQTSEGIFVYDPNKHSELSVGDKVRVAGVASEYGGMTQLLNVSEIILCEQNEFIAPTVIQLPFSHALEAEQYEGMLVEFEQTLTVSDNYNLGRYGELTLSNGRLMNPTTLVFPGSDSNKLQAKNDLNRIVLDDGSRVQNPADIRFPQPGLSAFNTVRGGDSVQGVSGVMHHAFGTYRVQAIQQPDFIPSNQRTLLPKLKESSLRIASFNVLNYFNGDGTGGGFPTSRGADSYEEFERQSAKIIQALDSMGADIIGLMELENDGYMDNSAIDDLVERLNTFSGRNFRFVSPDTDRLGTDEISVGIIYDSAKVESIGRTASLSEGVFSTKNRQPLAQSFREIDSNGVFTLIVNHFKSKGSCPSDESDLNADQLDGQGCWNLLRTQASVELANWLSNSPTGVADEDFLIIGDLNAYAMEDPIIRLESRGYQNVIKQFVTSAYSYVFMGQAGTLDHALVSDAFFEQVIDANEWHINSDEPKILDYNLEYKTIDQQSAYYAATPYRASDHDPVLIALNLKPAFDINTDGKLNASDVIGLVRHLFHKPTRQYRRYDLNQDKHIDILDLLMLIKRIKT
jgi:predicted extracellular nuclease